MCEDVGLEVGGLGELLVAAVEGADVGPVAGVDAHVRAQVKVQREAFPAAFKGALQEEEESGVSQRCTQDLLYQVKLHWCYRMSV